MNGGILALSDFLAMVIVRAFPEWSGAVLTASLVGLFVAFRLRARFAMFVLAAMTAVMISEVAIPWWYGRDALQGAATHFALLGSAGIGVWLGAVLVHEGWSSANRNRGESVLTP